ncbi:MAG: thioredoxin domain-containing protein, partial [Bacteroides sp.]|nr:thioredoxin domain-containing protein [Bacteroides sp.]
MNKIILSMFLSVAITACGNAQNSNRSQNLNQKENNMKTIALTKADFLTKVANYETNPNEWKYLGDKPAIVDFYATWCGPCKAVAPILEELAEEYKDQIYIYKVDTDKEQELAGAF